jgi:HTH-like domain
MEHQLPVAVVCRVLDAPRSTVYARRARTDPLVRPGPATSISDPDLLGLIHQVLAVSPFAGEGYRKIRARLRREHGIRVSGKRVLRLLRGAGLLAPQRARGRRKPRPHDGTIIPGGAQPALGYRCDHGLDAQRRVGVGVRLRGPLHRRGVGTRGQDRRPLRRPAAGL